MCGRLKRHTTKCNVWTLSGSSFEESNHKDIFETTEILIWTEPLDDIKGSLLILLRILTECGCA